MMQARYLLPHSFKRPGCLLFGLGFIAAIVFVILGEDPEGTNIRVLALVDDQLFNDTRWFGVSNTNPYDEFILLFLIIGGIMVAFSKEKDEDEFIAKMRLESLVWATYVNYSILLLALIFVFGIAFFWVMAANMFTLLFFFIIRFHWVMTRARKNLADYEE
jgi:hypothetical protein